MSCSCTSPAKGLAISCVPSTGQISITEVPLHTVRPSFLLRGLFASPSPAGIAVSVSFLCEEQTVEREE